MANGYAAAAAGIVGSILNYISNEHTNQANIQMQEAANQANRDIAQEQNQWNLMMWQRQNAYNDPSAQMSRLRAAGINPALAYANGGMMNEAAPAQEAAGATMQAAQIKPYYNDPLMLAQIANINADTEEKKSRIPVNQEQAANIRQQTQNLTTEGQILGLDLSKYQQTFDSLVDSLNMKYEADSAGSRYTVDKLNVDRRYLEENARNMAEEIRQRARAAEETANKYAAEADVAKEQKEMVKQQIGNLKKALEFLDEQIERMSKENKFITADKIFGYIWGTANAASNVLHGIGSLTKIAGNDSPAPVQFHKPSDGISPNYNFDMQ